MQLARAFQYAAKMSEFLFRILPERVSRFHVAEGNVNRDLGPLEPLLPFRLARDRAALFALAIFILMLVAWTFGPEA